MNTVSFNSTSASAYSTYRNAPAARSSREAEAKYKTIQDNHGDQFLKSSALEHSASAAGTKRALNSGFDIEGVSLKDFKEQLKAQLLEMMDKSRENNKTPENLIDAIMYDVSDDEVAAEVPEYWNAENTSQRIVDFAMSFKSLSGMEDEEYINRVRDAVVEGYKLAKEALGDLPGPSAKLFNDTYELTMKKFDEMLGEAKAAKQAPVNMVA